MPEEARGQHARIVENQAIARAQERGEFAKMAVFERPRGAVENQHAGSVALGGRLLRDQFLGKLVIEIGELHYSRESSFCTSANGMAWVSRGFIYPSARRSRMNRR